MVEATYSRFGQSRFYVVGTSYGDRATVIRKHCYDGMPATLRREPANPHDPNAISVWVSVPRLLFGTRLAQIGYLKRSHAAKLTKVIDAGGHCRAELDDVYILRSGSEVSPTVKLEVEYTGRDTVTEIDVV